MAFYGYNVDVGECHSTPFAASAYDLSPLEYVSYEIQEPRLSEYGSYSYFDSYGPAESVHSYYTCNLSESRLIQYDPPPSYAVDSFYSRISYATSYSNLEFNEPEFEEYDPTPYGGGYDPVQTYGKPLPPSDEICYPRSPLQPKPAGELLDSKNELPITPVAPKEEAEIAKGAESPLEPLIKEDSDNHPSIDHGVPKKSVMEEEGDDVEDHPSSDYEWNRQVQYVPYGSGLESLDLCESIFGYWPCLAKLEQQKKISKVCDDEYDPWKSTADYLFGSPFAYGELQNGGSSYQQHQNMCSQYQY